MADASRKWWSILRDGVVSVLVDMGVIAALKGMVPAALTEVTKMSGDHLKKKLVNDKRAEMLREFRRMDDAGMKLKKFWKRYQRAIDENREDHFVELVCKICPSDPADPLAIRPPVDPNTQGKPANDRQADILWMNNMSNVQFNRVMYFLDHDVISQAWQRTRRKLARAFKKTWADTRAAFVTMFAGMGAVGRWLQGALDGAERFCQSPFGKLFLIVLFLITLAFVFLPLALIALMLFTSSRRRATATSNVQRPWHQTFAWHFIVTAIGIALLTEAYFKLVPTFNDKDLATVVLLVIAATICFWSTLRVRKSLLWLMAILTVIFFLGGRTAALARTKAVWAGIVAHFDNTKKVNDLQKQLAEQNEKAARHESAPAAGLKEVADTKSEAETRNPPAPSAPEEEFVPLSDLGSITARMFPCKYLDPQAVRCDGYIQSDEDVRVHVDDTEGEYGTNDGRGGSFNVWLSNNSIQFDGGAWMKRLTPGRKTYFNFRFRVPPGATATDLGFTLKTRDSDTGHASEFVFEGIPIHTN